MWANIVCPFFVNIIVKTLDFPYLMSSEAKAFFKEQEEYEKYELNRNNNLVFDNIKNVKVNELPSQIYWNGIRLSESDRNEPYLFRYIDILKNGDHDVPIFYLTGDIISDRWNTEFIYPIFKKKIKQVFEQHNQTLMRT